MRAPRIASLHAALLAAAVVAISSVAIAAGAIWSTARVFSATVDEPAHLAAGLEWLSTGAYHYDRQHPPLGRIAIALGPYLRGERTTGAPAVFDEGARILGAGAHYEETLAAARHGVIVFFLLAALVVWSWTRQLAGSLAATIAVVLLATNPNMLAHAGLATTDVACAATTVLALFAFSNWLARPRWARALWCGACAGLALGSRLSAVAFLAAPMAAMCLLRGVSLRDRRIGGERASLVARHAAGAAAIAVTILLMLYRGHAGPLVDGLGAFAEHGSTGHPTFLLGRPGNRGWWYYFPVALLVKTPLPLLVLGLIGGVSTIEQALLRGRGPVADRERLGAVGAENRDWRTAVPIVSAASIVLVSLAVRVDLGVRLVLPVYPLLAIVAAQGTMALWRQSNRLVERGAVAALLAASAVIAVTAYPDFLSYFNVLAGDHPEHVLVDSNLDWGQDLYRLRDTLAARHVDDSVRVAYFGTLTPTAAGVPKARFLGLHEHATGWIAASETYLAGEWVGGAYAWLLDYPAVARVGPSMRLWYIPPSATPQAPRPQAPRPQAPRPQAPRPQATRPLAAKPAPTTGSSPR